MSKDKFNINDIDESDILDNYLDPLTNEIMTDPVRLPGSGNVIDRLVIKKHLLSDKTDPFNRALLKEEDLIEMPDLKKEI